MSLPDETGEKVNVHPCHLLQQPAGNILRATSKLSMKSESARGTREETRKRERAGERKESLQRSLLSRAPRDLATRSHILAWHASLAQIGERGRRLAGNS